jgi:hypothetical protein
MALRMGNADGQSAKCLFGNISLPGLDRMDNLLEVHN